MKKLFLMLAVLLVLLVLPGQAWAAEAQEDTYLTMEQQQEIVRQVKQIGIRVGVASYNPAKLQVSCPMPIYAYTEDGFRENGRFLPLLFEGQPLFFVVDYEDSYTLNTTIYDWLLQAGAAVDKPFALVWDKNSAYFYDGANWLLLRTFAHQRPDYAVLDISQPLDTSALTLTELRPVQSLADAYLGHWPVDDEVAVYFAGEKQETHGWLTGGRILLPLRDVCNMLAVGVDYDEVTQQITLHHQQDVYTLRLNDCQASCNGRQLASMDVPPQERDGVTYLPMRYLAKLLQMDVQWDEAARRVDLQPNGQAVCSVVRHVMATMENWDKQLDSLYWAQYIYDYLHNGCDEEVTSPEHIVRWPNLDIPDFYYLLTEYDFWQVNGSLAFSCEIYLHVPGQPLPEGYTEYLLHCDDKWYIMPDFSDVLAEWDNIEDWQRVD